MPAPLITNSVPDVCYSICSLAPGPVCGHVRYEGLIEPDFEPD
jgi:hypothetical protein